MPIRLNNNDAFIVSCITQYGNVANAVLKEDIKKCSNDAQIIIDVILNGKSSRAKVKHINAAQKLLAWHDSNCR
jgi:hypothetical protein